MSDLLPWLTLFGLGAFHGLNPAMGWLFAVALGMQEQRRAAVWRALPPIALGHAVSVALVVGLIVLANAAVSRTMLKTASAAILFGFGLYRLIRPRHPGWVGMRVGFRDLGVWSFVMASAHGAGLMLVPVFIGSATARPAVFASRVASETLVEPFCSPVFATFGTPALLAGSIGVHTLGHLLLAGALRWLVYEMVGVAIVRTAWANLDLIWSAALIATGAFVLFF